MCFDLKKNFTYVIISSSPRPLSFSNLTVFVFFWMMKPYLFRKIEKLYLQLNLNVVEVRLIYFATLSGHIVHDFFGLKQGTE